VTATAPSVRPDGVAFDVAEGTPMPGVPTGDQKATNDDTAQDVQESMHVPPGGLNTAGS
jgi:hypothetical protein